MDKIDRNWLKNVYTREQELPRCNDKITGFCDRSIFCGKYFKFLNGKTFKLQIKDKIYYALFLKFKISSTGTEWKYEMYGVAPALGWNTSEYILSFLDHSGERQRIRLHYNDLLRIRYKEITPEEFWNIYKLFTIPLEEFEYKETEYDYF